MIIFGLETATPLLGLTIWKDHQILGEMRLWRPKEHLESLVPAIEELCKQTHHELKEIDFFACDVGPGYFTTLRLGLATVQGLALALQKTMIPVCSLDALASTALPLPMAVLLHSTQDTFFYRCYQHGQPQCVPQLGTLTDVLQFQEILYWLTPDPSKVDIFLKEASIPISVIQVLPSAVGVVEWCLSNWNPDEHIHNPSQLQPLYLREARIGGMAQKI